MIRNSQRQGINQPGISREQQVQLALSRLNEEMTRQRNLELLLKIDPDAYLVLRAREMLRGGLYTLSSRLPVNAIVLIHKKQNGTG